ncbi:MaoC family dehydratase N-terminal domain-containing protein [Heyndrickxia oleronia]|uniref:MaoC family dehydratase n=1 Tax=Heyndrickxia oleronia TaxID=38875 RepID=UPI0015D2BE83|nr:MaoC/PaaZ C-terminal domain-containing protein [Heyndrickxia oleronia]MCM3455335.1 MaoC family dehydratase N-terminal domain-containing protein [Heyndrickxia oleronia]NYV64357.1 MaoC family dehydratase N-terminal domain-containing protein [Bacillus sp. Gen3]
MLLGKRRKIGRKIEEISIGEKLTLTETVEDKDLLLYLGLTNDANPLYIQHDYAAQTPFEKPIVPTIMLTGMITSAISKYLPGPGSHVVTQKLEFLKPIYHYSSIHFLFEVVDVHPDKHLIDIQIQATNDANETVIQGLLTVCPPHRIETLNEKVLDNF